MDAALEQIREQAYDGITTVELRTLFRNIIRARIKTLIESAEHLKKEFWRRSYAHNLSIIYPDALKYHMSGSIFIKNFD